MSSELSRVIIGRTWGAKMEVAKPTRWDIEGGHHDCQSEQGSEKMIVKLS